LNVRFWHKADIQLDRFLIDLVQVKESIFFSIALSYLNVRF
jgi:hypothetical protein